MQTLIRKMRAEIPERNRLAFAPAIPWPAQLAASLYWQDRSAGTVQQLSETRDKLKSAARKRRSVVRAYYLPAFSSTAFCRILTRTRVLKAGSTVRGRLSTLQAFLGGAYVII